MKRPKPATYTPFAWLCAALLVTLAIAAPVLRLKLGIPLIGPFKAEDGSFASSAVMQFTDEIRHGVLLPRWTFAGNFGLGSPVFIFYPPLVYYISSAFYMSFHGLSELSSLELASVFMIATSILTMTLWLRRTVGIWNAVSAGAIYGLLPYTGFFNPQARLAIAEMGAATIWPLLFWAGERTRGRPIATLLALTPVFAILTLTHIPTLILASGLVPFFCALCENTLRAAAVRFIAALLGLFLGVSLVAFYAAPVLVLSRETSSFFVLIGSNQNLLNPFLIHKLGPFSALLLNSALVLPLLIAAAWIGKWRSDFRVTLPVVGTLALAVFLCLPAAHLIWELRSPLSIVQFPWRLLQPIAVLGIAAGMRALAPGWSIARVYIMLLAVASGLMVLAFTVQRSDGGKASAAELAQAMAWQGSQVPEYTPRSAYAAKWVTGPYGADYHYRQHAQIAMSPCIRNANVSRNGVTLTYRYQNCGSRVVLPIFYFPGWKASVEGTPAVATLDRATGLLAVDLGPRSSGTVSATRTATPIEHIGVAISLAALVCWAALLVASLMRTSQFKRETIVS